MEPWRAMVAHSGGLEAENGALEGLPVAAVSYGTGTVPRLSWEAGSGSALE